MKNTIIIALCALLAACMGEAETQTTNDSGEQAQTSSAGGNDNAQASETTTEKEDGAKEGDAAASSEPKVNYGPSKKSGDWKVPEHIEVQHILICFTGAQGESRLPAHKRVARSEKDARALAEELVRLIREGKDMNPLVQRHTQDSFPGKYKMGNSTTRPGEIARRGMVKYFGDVSFSLDVGETAMTDYHPSHSPFGFHVIKRLR